MRTTGRLVPAFVALVLLLNGVPTPAEANRARSTAGETPSRLLFDETRYTTEDCASLRLVDPAANTNPAGIEEVPVSVHSERGDAEGMTLLETGENTGEFESQSCLAVLATEFQESQDGILQVNPGDILAAVQVDNDAPRSIDLALVSGGTPSGDFAIAVDPAVLPEGLPTETDSGVEGEPPLPLAAVEDPEGRVALFGTDQGVYRAVSNEELNALDARLETRVLNELQIPIPNEENPDAEEELATFTLLRFDPPTIDKDQTEFLMEKLGFKGTYTFSSQQAADLFATIVEEQLTGTAIGPSTMLLGHSAPVSNEGVHPDAFTTTWYDSNAVTSRVRAKEGLALMAVADHTAPVGTAILDGGFGGPGDYPAPWPAGFNNPDFGVPFNTASRCDVNAVGIPFCGPGAAAGVNPLTCTGGSPCPWHGLAMFSAAGARLNNGFGSTGSGGLVVRPMLYKVGLPYLTPVAGAIVRATTDGARVINLSSGFPCAAVLVDICSPGGALAISLVAGAVCPILALIPVFGGLACHAIISLAWGLVAATSALDASLVFAEASGVVVVASAGNDGRNATSDRIVPCTMRLVVCVGNLAGGTSDLVAAASSNFGPAIDIWAPGTAVPVTPDPTMMPPPSANIGSSFGTSPAAAFISGVVANIRSINPGLGAPAVRAVLAASRCNAAGPGRLDGTTCVVSAAPLLAPVGYVDVLETVRRARASAGLSTLVPCTGGWDEPRPPGAADDGPASAVILGLGGTPAGGTVTRTGNLSIHAFPTDEDWMQFQAPSFGAPTTDMTVRLSTSAPTTGVLRLELFRVSGATRNLLASQTSVGGVATFRFLFTAGLTYHLRVTAVGPVAVNDACYGSTVAVTVHGAGPAADRFEPNNSGGSPANLGVVNDSHVHHSSNGTQTEERWSKRLTGLSLHSTSDSDFYIVRLPDPQDSADGGHASIQECGIDVGTGFRGDVLYEGAAVVRATIPAGGQGRLDTFDPTNPSRTFGSSLDCPRVALGSPFRLGVSFVTVAGQTQPTNYDLDIEYKIRITRRMPQWLSEYLQLDKRLLATLVGRTGCFVPRCPPYKVNLQHVVRPSLLDVCAPRCAEYSPIGLEAGGLFDVTFESPVDLRYHLLDREEHVVLTGRPLPLGPRAPGAAATFVRRMRGQIPEPGVYFLRVAGPKGPFTMDPASIPTGQRELTIDESDPVVEPGSKVRISGRLQSSNPSCVTGKRVILQRKAPQAEGFRNVGRRLMEEEGIWFFLRTVNKATEFRAIAPKSGPCQKAISPVTRIKVSSGGN